MCKNKLIEIFPNIYVVLRILLIIPAGPVSRKGRTETFVPEVMGGAGGAKLPTNKWINSFFII